MMDEQHRPFVALWAEKKVSAENDRLKTSALKVY